jgi:hypothetical protein
MAKPSQVFFAMLVDPMPGQLELDPVIAPEGDLEVDCREDGLVAVRLYSLGADHSADDVEV